MSNRLGLSAAALPAAPCRQQISRENAGRAHRRVLFHDRGPRRIGEEASLASLGITAARTWPVLSVQACPALWGRSKPACRSVSSPSSTRLTAWPPCVCQEVHAPGGKSTTSCASSACWGALVTANRDTATALRLPWPPGSKASLAENHRAGGRSDADREARKHPFVKSLLHGIEPSFDQRATTIVVQALSSLGSSRLVAIRTLSLRSPPRTTGQ